MGNHEHPSVLAPKGPDWSDRAVAAFTIAALIAILVVWAMLGGIQAQLGLALMVLRMIHLYGWIMLLAPLALGVFDVIEGESPLGAIVWFVVLLAVWLLAAPLAHWLAQYYTGPPTGHWHP